MTVRRLLSLTPLLAVLFIAAIGPALIPFDPERVVARPALTPGGAHLMGTDSTGLDIFSRTIAATRTNLFIAGAVMVGATLAGIAAGLAIGMNESKRDLRGVLARTASRGVDLLQALPAVVIALVIVAFYGATVWTMVLSISIILAPNQARLVRTEVLKVRSDAYLDAARMAGLSELQLTVRHVLPNSVRPAVENASIIFGIAIVLTAALGFLGVGLPPPAPEWGSMIARGTADAARGRWWASLFPAVALSLTVASVATANRALLRAGGR